MYQIAMTDQGLSIEPNYAMKASQATSSSREHYNGGGFNLPRNDWWLDSAQGGNVLQAWTELGVSGRGVNIAIIDTGFLPNDYDITSYNPHAQTVMYSRRWSPYQYNFDQGATNAYDVTADSNGDPDYYGHTFHGHGVASVALAAQDNQYGVSGVAPLATPILFRIGRSPSGLYSYYDAGRAVDTAIAWGAHIINMSFLAYTPGEAGVPNSYLGEALQRSENAGLINVAAMGNDNKWVGNSNWWWDQKPVPASWSTVIGVGATNISRQKASYSNWGPEVDLWAPAGDNGTLIRTAPNRWESCYATPMRCGDRANYLGVFDGTSAASPYVAGAIALMKEVKPSLTRAEALSILQQTSYKNTGDANVDGNGSGLINVYAAVKMARGW